MIKIILLIKFIILVIIIITVYVKEFGDKMKWLPQDKQMSSRSMSTKVFEMHALK